MSAIKDATDRFNAKLDVIGTGLVELGDSIQNVAGDVTYLKDVITKLQNNPGPISPEDQALLDAAEARLGTTADRVAALGASAKGLADATVPEPPPPTT